MPSQRASAGTHHPPDASPFPAHIPALDGLRGLAVLAVIAYHLSYYLWPAQGLAGLLLSAVSFGWTGVDLFFVLSGFLITGILYDTRNSPNRLRAFYGRRFLRIVPVYYIGLAVYLAVAPSFGTPDDLKALHEALPWHAAYLTNVLGTLAQTDPALPMGTGHLWSLAIEEQFYLLWPATIALVLRLAPAPRTALMWVCGTLVLAAVLFRLAITPEFVNGAYFLLPARMDALAIGGFLALWIRGPNGARPAAAASGPMLLGCSAVLVLLALPSAGLESHLHPIQQGAGYTVWAAMFGSLLIAAAARPDRRLARALSIRPLRATGRISYALYLFHAPIIYAFVHSGWLALGFVPFAVAVLGVSFTVAILSWHFMEGPLLKLKGHFAYLPPEIVPATTERLAAG